MENVFVWGFIVALALVLVRWQAKRSVPAAASPPSTDPTELARPLDEHFGGTAHPRDVRQHPPFQQAAQSLAESDRPTAELLGYVAGAKKLVACLALEAIARRRDDMPVVDTLLTGLNSRGYWNRYFVLRALHARTDRPLVGEVLLTIDDEWLDPLLIGMLQEFTSNRTGAGETARFGDGLERLSADALAEVERILRALGRDGPPSLAEEIEAFKASRIDKDLLNSLGTLWSPSSSEHTTTVRLGGVTGEVFSHDGFADGVEAMLRALQGPSTRSLLIVGEAGVGKSAMISAVATRLRADGWYVLEASANDLLAGQIYIGQLEGQLRKLIEELRGRQILWFVPNLIDLVWAGKHEHRPTGIADMVLPYLESGAIRMIAEVRPAGQETAYRAQPRLRGAMDVVKVLASDDETTLTLARQWAEAESASGPLVLSEAVLTEAFQLANQYLGQAAAPGNLLRFLQLTLERNRAGAETDRGIAVDDLLWTLSQLSGLPLSILDNRRDLDTRALREFFTQRVMGQSEAVECLVERVAMIKAGVTDPTRPEGVFLFVGPTGTGKTEIAKALAAYLFGSADRMIRLDMSELQSLEDLERLIGVPSGEASGSGSLVQQIQKEPFSVVLLDEFEKAHTRAWDLFLQLFDDGRLTDRAGNTANFRHAIVILTSNLGAAVKAGGLGFASGRQSFSGQDIERSLTDTFRPEFLNRIDRVVVFQPLARELMRKLLDKELAELHTRRGLRNRQWAMEWEESAVEFLLERGFSPQFGARPLRRAVERYLLTPLALAIVERAVPEGDSFLLVRHEGDGLVVDWIDPDLSPLEEPDEETAEPSEGRPVLESIALHGRGSFDEVEALTAEYEDLRVTVEGPAWEERKAAALRTMGAPAFWESPERYDVMALAEYMDRIEVGLRTAGSLLRRISDRVSGGRRRYPAHLVRRLAERLYLLSEALTGLDENEPPDAFLEVRAHCEPGAETDVANAFAERLGSMYKRWSEKRGMRAQVLHESSAASGEAYELIMGVTGFAAYSILVDEVGHHVLEIADGGRAFRRVRTAVGVAPQPQTPVPGRTAQLAQARAALRSARGGRDEVVRRYREAPSQLVRDSVRDWRTGRLDLVFGGDFDLIT